MDNIKRAGIAFNLKYASIECIEFDPLTTNNMSANEERTANPICHNDPHRYDRIIHLLPPEPTVRPRMAIEKRAAQFAPFAALTGYEESVAEEARLTEEKLELSEDMIDMIDARLAVIQHHIKEQPNIAVTYFIPDNKKAGGRYVTVSGNVKMLDRIERAIIMADRTEIPIEDVRYIEGDLFRLFE